MRMTAQRLRLKMEKEAYSPLHHKTKGKGISIMIWAAIWGGGHAEIYRMNRDEESICSKRVFFTVLF